jgi:hypothetical protein
MARAIRAKERAHVHIIHDLCDRVHRGEQHYRYDLKSGTVVADPALVANGVVLNVTQQVVRILSSKASAMPSTLEGVPDSRDSNAINLANATSTLLEHWSRTQEWERLDEEIDVEKLVIGKGYEWTHWDKDAKDYSVLELFDPNVAPPPKSSYGDGFEYIGRRPYKDHWVDVFYGPFGDYRVSVLPASRVFVGPGIDNLEDANRFFLSSHRSLS